MISFDLSNDNIEIRDRVRDFVTEAIVPSDLQERERISDGYERFPWDIIERGSNYELRELSVPEAYGGHNASTTSLAIASEELGYGDVGIATTFAQCWRVARLINKLGTDEQRGRFFQEFTDDKRYLTAIAATEPKHGSNNTLPYDGNNLTTTATLQDDCWVLDGEKRFITNGPLANMLIVLANTDDRKGRQAGTSMFMVPSETPGVSIGTIYDKVGERLKVNGDIRFDNCRIPRENILGERNRAFQSKQSVAPGRLFSAARFLGLSKRAYHEARQHAENRVQGGKPIIQHNNIKLKFAEMATRIETARSLIYRTSWAFDAESKSQSEFIDMSNLCATDCCREVCLHALSIFGGLGVMRTHSIEKYIRDALNSGHAEGHEDILKLRVGSTADQEVIR